ncbi:YiiX/YebB-like N1pC/P60 family cysteine hydrolase [Lactovum odontotermitis]
MSEKFLKTGDLIGVANALLPESEWSAAIAASSRADSIYDHIGMVEVLPDGQVFVWNANPTDGVIAEPLDVFTVREEARVRKVFDVFRVTAAVNFDEVLEKMRPLAGLPYNFSFVKAEQSYYCSDLIARSFPENVFPAAPMHFEGDFWQGYYDELGIDIPEGQPGTHPNDMLAQANVVYIENLRNLIYE